jgi:hypothetical protein
MHDGEGLMIALRQSVGSSAVINVGANSTPKKAERPPAVCRIVAPIEQERPEREHLPHEQGRPGDDRSLGREHRPARPSTPRRDIGKRP